MVDVVARETALRRLVERISAIAPANWMQIYAAFEYKTADGEPSFTWLMLGVVNLGQSWGFGQLDNDPQVYDLAMAYRRACGDEPWTALELRVDYDGEFHADQGYGLVRSDDEFDPALLGRLQDYGQTWTRKHGAAPQAR